MHRQSVGWTHELAAADFRHASRIALSRHRCRCWAQNTSWRGRRSWPAPRCVGAKNSPASGTPRLFRPPAGAPATTICARHQRLEQPERRRRPVADAVVAPGQQAHLDDQRTGGHGSALAFALLLFRLAPHRVLPARVKFDHAIAALSETFLCHRRVIGDSFNRAR